MNNRTSYVKQPPRPRMFFDRDRYINIQEKLFGKRVTFIPTSQQKKEMDARRTLIEDPTWGRVWRELTGRNYRRDAPNPPDVENIDIDMPEVMPIPIWPDEPKKKRRRRPPPPNRPPPTLDEILGIREEEEEGEIPLE